MNDKLPKEIKWRGSTYTLESVEGDEVTWTNAVSRFKGNCSVDGWKKGEPYEKD